MPKIRSGIKNPYTKSGSVTKTFKNVIKEHDSNQGFYPTNKFTTGFKLDDFNQIFDDLFRPSSSEQLKEIKDISNM